jgi:hypothetical protein
VQVLRQPPPELLEIAQMVEGDYTLFRNYEGGWEMIAGADWPPDALAAERGAREIYILKGHKRPLPSFPPPGSWFSGSW